ncbi:MAG TPA: hypothetical protein VJI96_00400 [Candidatus Andersenbacteria bacterium]|nr:hypothetical protein [Candidatus Andersenbacteria bacterium]
MTNRITDHVFDARRVMKCVPGLVRTQYTEADVCKLLSDETLARLLPSVRQQPEVLPPIHVIRCGKEPAMPGGIIIGASWKIEQHLHCEDLTWSADSVRLEEFPEKKMIRDDRPWVFLPLPKKPFANANVANYLLRHTHLIPDSWKMKNDGEPVEILFLGTLFGKHSAAQHDEMSTTFHVQTLYFSRRKWRRGLMNLTSWRCGASRVAVLT